MRDDKSENIIHTIHGVDALAAALEALFRKKIYEYSSRISTIR